MLVARSTFAKLAKSLGDRSDIEQNYKYVKKTYDLPNAKSAHIFELDAGYLVNAKGEEKRENNGKKYSKASETVGSMAK